MKRTLKAYNERTKAYKKTRQTSQKTKNDNTKIARIARKVILKAAETKLYAAQSTFNVNDNAVYAINVNSPIVVGSTSVDRIGTKIQMMNIRIHSMFYSNAATGNSTTKAYRISVIKTPTRLTATAAAIAAADVYKQGTTTTVLTAHFDLKKVKLLLDEVRYVNPDPFAALPTRLDPVQISVPVNKSEIYETDTSTYIQSGNYYILFSLYDGNGAVSPGGFNLAYTVSFKDE